MTPRAWQPRPLQSAGTGNALFDKLTGRNQTMAGTAVPPQPQPVEPVVADMTGEDLTVPTVADLVDMHTPGHPHMDGDHADHFDHPDGLGGDEWDGT